MTAMKRFTFLALLTAIFIVALLTHAHAAVPGTMTYQGRLSNASSGTPITANVNITFKIYTVLSGGSHVWTETINGVTVTNGLFTVTLGETTPITSSVINSADLYIGVTVGADAEMTPRQKLAIVPYSVRAAEADHAVTADSATTATTATGVAWGGITGMPAGFSDGVDNNSGGTVTSVTAGSGLSGGTITGSGTIDIAVGGVTASHLNQNGCTTNQIMKWNGSAWVCADTTNYSFLVSNFAVPLTYLAGSWTLIPFTTVEFDHGSVYNVGSSSFVAPVTGVYSFSTAVYAIPSGGACYFGLGIFKDGFFYRYISYDYFVSGAYGTVNGSITMPINANQAISVRFVSSCMGITFVPSSLAYFSGHLVHRL